MTTERARLKQESNNDSNNNDSRCHTIAMGAKRATWFKPRCRHRPSPSLRSRPRLRLQPFTWAVGGSSSASFEYVLKCGNLSRLETRQRRCCRCWHCCCPHQTNAADDQRFINKTFVRPKSPSQTRRVAVSAPFDQHEVASSKRSYHFHNS